MLDGDEIYQKTIEDEQIEIRQKYIDDQEQESLAEFQYSRKSGRNKKKSDKIFKRESDITKDKNDLLK